MIPPAYPPATDLRVEREPPYPVEALSPGPVGAKAEDKWWMEVLAWGRAHHDRLRRVCRWSRDMGLELPDGYCG